MLIDGPVKRFAIVLIGLLGCDDAVCVDGVCADPEETRTFPGPCTSRSHSIDDYSKKESIVDGTFEYDAAGNLTRVTSTFDGWGGAMSNTHLHRVDATHWTYDENGDYLRIEGAADWTFDAQHVIGSSSTGVTTTYDRATFAFLPLVGREGRLEPGAILGAISSDSGGGVTTFTWTRTGQVVTCIGTDSGDGAVTTTTFQLDDNDNIIHWWSANSSRTSEGRYEFDGDHLTDIIYNNPYDDSGSHYTYDRGGNLIKSEVSFNGQRSNPEVFSYACWD